MRVLIIGNTGIISTAISGELLERGDDVVLYNRGKTERLFRDGASHILGDRRTSSGSIVRWLRQGRSTA